MESLVSIITPCYNAERYLSDSIESVLHQNYNNWELILIDDRSRDKTVEIAENYCKQDRRIKLIKLEKNLGVAGARNAGIAKAKGKFIAFLDSDDLWTYNKLSVQIKFMEVNNYLFTHTNVRLIDKNGETLNKIRNVPFKLNYNTLLKGNSINCLSVIINVEEIKTLKMPQVKHEDYATWLKILRTGVNAYGLQQQLGYYRVLEDSVSSNKIRTLNWTWNIYYKQEKLGLLKSCYYMNCFIFNTSIKYLK